MKKNIALLLLLSLVLFASDSFEYVKTLTEGKTTDKIKAEFEAREGRLIETI